jgi:hypothetical protein
VAEPAKSSTFGTDKVILLPRVDQFDFMTDLPVHAESRIEDMRAVLFEKLKSRGFMAETDSVKQVRIRLKGGQTCTDVLLDTATTLRQSKVAMYADRALAVQVSECSDGRVCDCCHLCCHLIIFYCLHALASM